jgi:UDP-N-acetylglucosamine 2-epimerase (non-hydrolysing)
VRQRLFTRDTKEGPAVSILRACLVLGTRPEAIKLAPLLKACERRRDIEPFVCSTGQHREMLAQVTSYFGLQVDLDLGLMQPNQTLAGLSARCLEGVDRVLADRQPDCVIAQGDTTTVMAASLAAFYRRIPFVHVEAGLRTGNMQSPWPEELNRRIAGLTTAVHCAPTRRAAQNLLEEGTPAHTVHITGNTVVDALLWAVDRERSRGSAWQDKYAKLGDRRMVLITGHRRENFGQGFEDICRSIRDLAEQFAEVEFVYPVHLNPNVQQPVRRILGEIANVHLTAPAAYPEFVWLMDRCTLILTDSGGVQEEAPSLRKPVLVMRDTTERPEAVEAGAVELVGTSPDAIVAGVARLLTDPVEYAKRQLDRNPYGDGRAAERIVDLVVARAWAEPMTVRRAA